MKNSRTVIYQYEVLNQSGGLPFSNSLRGSEYVLTSHTRRPRGISRYSQLFSLT